MELTEKFLRQKKSPDNSEGEQHHALSPKKKQRVRTYDKEYVKLGFIQCHSDATKPQWLLCFKVLSNDAMKPSGIKPRLMSEHPEFASKPQSFLKENVKNTLSSRKVLQHLFCQIKNC